MEERNTCKVQSYGQRYSTNRRHKTTVKSMHTDVFYHLLWQSLTLSKWRGAPCQWGPRVKAVHRDFTKWGGELLLTSPQVVISAAGEGMLIFFAWQISNIMHCQIILNTASVTRWPRSQYSDLLWLINSGATACHWPINQDISNSPPHHHLLWLFFTCQPIWIWGGAWMASTK